MHNTRWQGRLKRAGLTQLEVARILDVDQNTIRRQVAPGGRMRGYLIAFIVAWETMSPAQKDEWLAGIEAGRSL